MADASRIEWTDATWNPIRARNLVTGKLGWHCTHVSEGCRNCYAEPINRRLGTGLEFKPQLLGRGLEVFLDEAMLRAPLRWKKPRRIFVGSMSDLFGEFVTDAMLDRIFAVMALCPQHTFQVLTKRAARMRRYVRELVDAPTWTDFAARERTLSAAIAMGGQAVPATWPRWPLQNVWKGVSAEDQAAADERIPELLRTPAAVRFVSNEPALGPVDYTRLSTLQFRGAELLNALTGELTGLFGDPCATELARLDLVIAGGESGPHARPMHPDWPRQIRDACAAAGTAFFFKQWGEWAPVCAIDDTDRHYRPAPVRHPEASRRCKVDQLVMHRDGRILRGHEMSTFEAYAVGSGAMLTMRVGKKAAGRLLDGVEHNAMPAVAA